MNSEVDDNVETEHVYSMDEALAAVGFGKFQVLVLSYAGLGVMSESMEVMILSFIGPLVKAEWGISSAQESLITTAVFAGMLVGAYIWGLISDHHGRRIGLLSVAVVDSLFSFLSSFSPNYISLTLFRTMAGIGLGGEPVYLSWFLEFVPVDNRGSWMVIFSAFWTFGTILEASLAWIVLPRLGWRWLLGLSSVPCLMAFMLYFLTIESPRYLYMKGRTADLHCLLMKMAAVNKTELPSSMVVSYQVNETGDESPESQDIQLLYNRDDKTITSKPGCLSLSTLLSPRLLKTTLLLWVVYFANSFSYYGVVLMTSELSSGQSKCRNPNLLTDSSLYSNVFMSSVAELPGLIFAAILVDKIGRRLSLVIVYSFCFAFLLPLMFYQNGQYTMLMLVGARMCTTGIFAVASVYCPELYPTSVRTTGVGVATAVGRIAGMLCPLVAVGLVSSCHQFAAASLFEAVIFLAGISVLLFRVETKGRGLDDIIVAHG